MNVFDGAIRHTHARRSFQRCEGQLQIRCDLGGNHRDTRPSVEKSKVGVFSEVGDMGVKAENCSIRRELFVAENFFYSDIETLLLALVIPSLTKMRGKISTPSAKTCPTTPFAFGSGLERRERIGGLNSRKMTDELVRNVRFDILKRVPICTMS